MSYDSSENESINIKHKNNEQKFKKVKEFSSLSESDTKKTSVKIMKIGDELYVDIRKMWRSRAKEDWSPSSKGIFLNLEEFQLLMCEGDRIIEELAKW